MKIDCESLQLNSAISLPGTTDMVSVGGVEWIHKKACAYLRESHVGSVIVSQQCSQCFQLWKHSFHSIRNPVVQKKFFTLKNTFLLTFLFASTNYTSKIMESPREKTVPY